MAALAVGLPAGAEETLEVVVVSATRSEQPLEKTGTSVSVLTGDEIDRRQSPYLTDALAALPSLTINRTGSVGQTATVSIRGAEQGQTVTLIDGIRLNDPSDVSGGTLFGDLMVNNISRIEVLAGAQSALYGSDAIGGVVNILTRRGGDHTADIVASAEYGTYNTHRLNVAANGTIGAVEYGTAINEFATKGISSADSRNGNTESDGTHNVAATVNTRTHLDAAFSLDLRGYVSHAHTAFDDNYAWTAPYALSDSAAYSTDALYAGYAGINGDGFAGRFHNRVALIATTSDRDFYDSGSDSLHHNYAYTGAALRLEYQGTVEIETETELTFGAESERTTFTNDSFSSYAAATRIAGHKRITGGYAQLQHTLFDQLTLTGAVRYDDDEEFGNHTSSKFAAAWAIPGWDTTVRANYADGFKAPTLYQLYSAYSNPIASLKPEQAKAWEAGIDRRLFADKVTASLTYFERRNGDQIDFQNCYSAADAAGCPYRLSQYGYYVNTGRTMARGIEVAVAAALTDTLSLSLRYTNLSAYNRTTHLDLSRRPQDSAYAVATWSPLNALRVGTDVRFTGKRFNDASESTRLGAYASVGLFADYDIDARWQVFARIDNLTNDRTERVTGYGTPGLAASFGIRLRQSVDANR